MDIFFLVLNEGKTRSYEYKLKKKTRYLNNIKKNFNYPKSCSTDWWNKLDTKLKN